MRPIRRTFKGLHIGVIFTYNGNDYIKKTTRTAYLIKYNKVFYFKANEVVWSTGKYSSLYDGRYTVRLECNGNAAPVYVTRFCGEYLGDSGTKQDGAHLADWHLNARLGTLNHRLGAL